MNKFKEKFINKYSICEKDGNSFNKCGVQVNGTWTEIEGFFDDEKRIFLGEFIKWCEEQKPSPAVMTHNLIDNCDYQKIDTLNKVIHRLLNIRGAID